LTELSLLTPSDFVKQHNVAFPKLSALATDETIGLFWTRRASRPVWYRSSMLRYQQKYLEGAGQRLIDLSLVYRDGDNKVVAFAPLSAACVTQPDGSQAWRICSVEEGVRAPLFNDLVTDKRRDEILDEHVRFCIALSRAVGTTKVRFSELPELTELSQLYRTLLELNAKIWTEVGLYTDLRPDESTLWNSVRRRFRSLINQATRTWATSIVEKPTRLQFDEFRLLHLEVAGRVTRSIESWDEQFAATQAGDAFLVSLRNTDDRLVGCALIHTTESDGLYAVGAYDRALYKTPVSHVAQWTAIKHLKATKRERYFIGLRFYSHSPLGPSEKEVSIAYFKEGFANSFLPHHYFDVTL
jgi:FemAB family protein